MIDLNKIKVTVVPKVIVRTTPFDSLDEPKIPSTQKIEIVADSLTFSSEFSDLLERLFASVDTRLTEDVLKDLLRYTNPNFPDQFLISYRGVMLGLVFVKSDMFSNILTFRGDIKNFTKDLYE